MQTRRRYLLITLAIGLAISAWQLFAPEYQAPLQLSPLIEPEVAQSDQLVEVPQPQEDINLLPPPAPIEQKLEALRIALRRDHSQHTVHIQPDGSKVVHLGGSYQTAAAARRTDDGKIIIQCFERFQPAKDFIENTAPASPPASAYPTATR